MKVKDFLSILGDKNPEYEVVFKPSPFGYSKVVLSLSQKKVFVYLYVSVTYKS